MDIIRTVARNKAVLRLLASLLLAAGPCLAVLAAAADTASGEAAYALHCRDCHGAGLAGSAHGPPLRGRRFRLRWLQAPEELLAYVASSMPPGAADRLSHAEQAAIVQWLLAENAGDGQAASEPAAGQWESFSAAGSIDEWARRRTGFRNRRLETFHPVTLEMLAAPPPGDWLSWRRSLDGQAHSPLAQIDRDNVGQLRLAWALAMESGSNQGTPLVHDGVMFLTHPGNVVQAVDAANGDLLWEYRYRYPPEARTLGGPTRNIAIFGERLFLATYDAALVAIDARNGQELWRVAKADYRDGYTHSSGPIIAAGVVVSGINGCERYKRGGCFITGHDPETGRELWRLSTIALPGDPNDASWGGLAPEYRAGGDTWIAGSYDPALGLVYIGTSQAKPWVAASRGMHPRDAALYTNSTLALDPVTGRLVWFFQHLPGESLDMETAFERVLVDLDGRPLLVTVGKDGILWQLDRRDGRFVALRELLPQNIYALVDREQGRLVYRQDILDADIGERIEACPGIYGGHNWQASAYDPASASLIVPLHRLCSEMIGRPVERQLGGGGYGGDSRTYPMPGSNAQLGLLLAVDLRTLETRWAREQAALFLSGVLTTAGGLTFIGDLDRRFQAIDTASGRLLWERRLGAPLHGFPISYLAGGRQFVAVQTGIGVFRALTATLSPEIYQPTGGQMLYVFTVGD